jgi:hypothetical protein
LPGADELFRRTAERQGDRSAPSQETSRQDTSSTKLQIAESDQATGATASKPKHDEKITIYCTSADLVALEQARLKLRAEHGLAADRGRIVRAALAYILEDFEARARDSVLVRQLTP